jgi:hypothetical protein
MSFWAMKKYGRTSNAYCQLKKTNLKNLHTIWLHLPDSLSRKGRIIETIKRSVIAGIIVRNEWFSKTTEEVFENSKSTLYCNSRHTSLYMYKKPTESSTPRVKLHVNYRLWMIITSPCWLISNKHTTLVVMLRMEEAMHV